MHHPLRHKPLFESCKQQKQGNDKLKHSSTLDAATGLILLKYSFHLAMTLQKKIKIKLCGSFIFCHVDPNCRQYCPRSVVLTL